MKKVRPLPRGIPAALKFGNVSFDIYATADDRLGFRYKLGSEWKQAIRGNIEALREDAERISLSLLNGDTAADQIDAEDRRIYISAREQLAPFQIAVDRGGLQVVQSCAAKPAIGQHRRSSLAVC
jgi:hypothetical protein